jgi:hypothetical protein
MAVHLSIGRIPSILLLALLGPAVVAVTASYMSRPEPETAPAAQVTAAVPRVTPPAETKFTEIPLAAVAEIEAALAPEGEDEIALQVDAEDEGVLEPAFETVIVIATEPEAAPSAEAIQTAPAKPVANAGWSEPRPTEAPVAAPVAAPAASQGRVTIARLVVEPQKSPAPRESVVSYQRPKNMAPIPRRAPRAPGATAAGSNTARSAATLFKNGTEIKIQKDASVYITARNVPENDRLLEAYSAEQPNGGRVQTRLGEAAAVPGLLGIAAQAHRTQSGSHGGPAYSLADAMRDAIWRKNTAARLKSLTTAQNACAGGAAGNAPSIGLAIRC